ncbi:MAG: UDP-N-acetylglucosamine 2-epimerase (non-hydrolyzing), partial [Candidatus Parabeggiatoa sp.]|nr:UDP-N-acetylglucosamine 2-epimerase (non-hydrolyzing) [Candidatus Parabeggiatoa sp.]
GARPQFIKAATISRHIRERDDIREVLVHTGQHYNENLSDIFFKELDIPHPDYHLGIGSGTHGVQTGQMLAAIEDVLFKEKPDWVLVYGDTNSTLAGALAAVKLHIPVAHVEAGLRSFNRQMPEEINRVLTDHAADLLFAPTSTAVQNLKNEGIPANRIYQVGDVMQDAALYYGEQSEKYSRILNRLGLLPRKYILATLHRAENTDNSQRLNVIFNALMEVAREIPIVLPLHPRTKKALIQEGLRDKVFANLQIIEPVGYLDMVALEKNACLMATDSGGVQKEAFFHQVPCVTLREETEWVELVEQGFNRLAGASCTETIVTVIKESIGQPQRIAPTNINIYGNGKAAMTILDILAKQ